MAENRYCAPCRQFLQGKAEGWYTDRGTFFFNHHPNVESFDKAKKLPCSICTLAWGDAREPRPATNWKKPIEALFGYHEDPDQLLLRMGHSPLIFVPWPYPTKLLSPDYAPEIAGTAPLTRFGIPETLSSNTQSESSLDFVLSKFRQCCETHTRCQIPEEVSSPVYPSRLLNVGTEQSGTVVLCNTASFREEKYVCLSHCWGTVKPLTLNAQTHRALTDGVDIEALPKTFQDAVSVTRLLQVRYIWIDSLCILQDDKDDWGYESQRMGDIYANSVCTIAATASKDSSGGLFFERSPDSILPRLVQFDWPQNLPWTKAKRGTFLCEVGAMPQRYIEEAPLNKRAWVSQERQLSTRVIHFTSGQLFWECREMTACETYRDGLPGWAQARWGSDGTVLKKGMRVVRKRDRRHSETDLTTDKPLISFSRYMYLNWLAFRDLYSSCALTNPSDKLVAIQGIANWVGRVMDDQLVAGLWRGCIVEELCWSKWTSREDRPGSEVWRAPTWSWAASDNQINQGFLTKTHGQHSSHCITPMVVDIDVKTRTSGELEHASMKLKCRLLHALYTRSDSLEGKLELRNESKLQDELEPITLDQISWPAMWSCMDRPYGGITSLQYGYVVLINYCLHEATIGADWTKQAQANTNAGDTHRSTSGIDWGSQDCAQALFLQTHDNIAFKRAGLFTFHNYRAVHQIIDAHNLAEDRVITLI